jgi:tetratricopeptide (TPR) repeat protein
MDKKRAGMNRPLLGRIIGFLFLFYALSFGIFYLVSALRFTSELVLPSLRWTYALDRAFVLFMSYLLPVHAAAIAVAASLGGSQQSQAPGAPARPFNRIAASSIVTFLVLSIVYTLTYEITYPAARHRLVDLQYTTGLARQIRTQSETAERSRDYRASLGLVNRYLTIDPGNREMRDRKVSLESLAARQAEPPAPREAAGAGGASLDAQALVERARYYFDRQDWFSAHYYARKANLLDPRRTDALRLAAEASEKLDEAATPGHDKDVEGASVFEQKRLAYLLLSAGDYVQAYYSFVKLAALYPRDRDVVTYLQKASEEVGKVSFFLDEAQRVEPLPGPERILFLNRLNPDGMEAVAISRMVRAREGTYFLGIEAVRYDAGGRVAWHFSAPYGKLENGTILMRCIDRKNPAVQFVPLYLQGARSAQERNILAVQPSEDEMQLLSTARDALADAGPVELWRMRDSVGSLGLSRGSITVELVMKLVMPFAFLILSLFALSFGWAFRLRSPGRLSGLSVVLIPLVPLVLSVLTLLYVYAHRVVLGFAVLAFGFSTALIVGAVLQFVLLAAALVALAGQSGG